MRRTRIALALTAAVALAGAVGAVSWARPADSSTSGDDPLLRGYVERVEVSFVVLHTTVLDRRGDAVTGLQARDFKVMEDGQPRRISVFGSSMDQPVRVAFLLDVSGSMALMGKLDRAKDVIRDFATSLLPEDEFALLIFADGKVVVKLGFTSDRDTLDTTLKGIDGYGKTALINALAEAPTLLSAAMGGRKALIILTDGVDNASSLTTWQAIRSAREAAVPIFTVGITDLPLELHVDRPATDGGRSPFQILKEFTQETGGDFFPVYSPIEIRDAAARVATRLRAQYILGYRPGPGSDAPGFHKIQVTTSNTRHQVLTRQGYYSGS